MTNSQKTKENEIFPVNLEIEFLHKGCISGVCSCAYQKDLALLYVLCIYSANPFESQVQILLAFPLSPFPSSLRRRRFVEYVISSFFIICIP